jgi:hypothetical protein
VDNTKMGSGGVDDFRGWTFMLQDQWQEAAADQNRKLFGRAGVIAVADPDEWHDRAVTGRFNSWLNSPVTSPVTPIQICADFSRFCRSWTLTLVGGGR